MKTLEEFDFTGQSGVHEALAEFLHPDFATSARGLILSGAAGRGKTHLAIAIAHRAVQNGFGALFTTATALVDDLSLASRRGQLQGALQTYLMPDVLIVDDVGASIHGQAPAHLLLRVVRSRRDQWRPTIVTTPSIEQWTRIFRDGDLAESLIDAVLEHGRHVHLVRRHSLNATAACEDLPELLRPLFPDYRFERLRLPDATDLVMLRVLTRGCDVHKRWLERSFGEESIRRWILTHGAATP